MAKQLTIEEREVIAQMRYAGESQAAIARQLGRHRSTIGRELLRNGSGDRYFAVTAESRAQTRRMARWFGRRKMECPQIVRMVEEGLRQKWSPDQIAGRSRRLFRRVRKRQVGRQTIYNWIAQRRRQGDDQWRGCLRSSGWRRKHRPVRSMEARSLAGRPAVVDRRSRYGDWEGDTMVGVRHRGAVVTHVDRKSGYLLADLVANRRAACVTKTIARQFAELPLSLRRTITFDRGKEFSEPAAVTEKTGMAVYFADPSCPWQRGCNENANGLLRQYFPKGTDFTKVPPQEMQRVEQEINHRPRQRLNYRTPAEVLARFLKCCN
jgi:IS30 family transposase